MKKLKNDLCKGLPHRLHIDRPTFDNTFSDTALTRLGVGVNPKFRPNAVFSVLPVINGDEIDYRSAAEAYVNANPHDSYEADPYREIAVASIIERMHDFGHLIVKISFLVPDDFSAPTIKNQENKMRRTKTWELQNEIYVERSTA